MPMTTTHTDAARDRVAAAALAMVEDGMTVGLGTGDTARRFVQALGRRVRDERMRVRCVVTSNATEALARRLARCAGAARGGDGRHRVRRRRQVDPGSI
jgi:ribose 5-phosphate isomerase A